MWTAPEMAMPGHPGLRPSGTNSLPLPAGACDCHMHILGPLAAYPYREMRSLRPPEHVWTQYEALAAETGLARRVIVQPSVYATDNACTLDTASNHKGSAAAVVVVDPQVSATELEAMHAKGARAVRMQSLVAGGLSIDHLESVAEKIAPLGWHIEIYIDSSDLPGLAARLWKIEVPVVFDHMAQWLDRDRIDEKGFHTLLDLVGSGKAWAKLTNARHPPSRARACRLIATNPERVVWGSDWPHISYQGPPPRERDLLDQLCDWVDRDVAAWHRILVTNPQALYFKSMPYGEAFEE